LAEEEEGRKLEERILRYERESRHLRKDSDQRKVLEEVFDRSTLVAVEDLVRRGDLADLNGVVNAGKEARVYWGVVGDGEPRAVKIYMVSSAEFKKRMVYIAGDRRFGRLPSGSRETINLWVQKEFKNLKLADSSGVRVPRPFAFHRNILVMEYIGEPPRPAPTMAETDVDEGDLHWVVDSVKRLYRSAGLVHADLSEFNVFKRDDERVLFDFGSAVLKSHPRAQEFLLRDVTNMVRFFRKRGLNPPDPASLVGEISE
jgi:RIO kinase 1